MKIKDINNRVSNTPDNIREEVTPISTEYISGLFQHQGDESNPLEYYTKSQTYNRQEIDSRIANVSNELSNYSTKGETKIVDDKVIATNNRVTEVDNRVTEVDDKVMTVDGRATAIDDKLTEVKGSVTSINNEINKSNNTKHQTVNGVKEFECKDGYTDNMVIEGKTLKSNLLTGQAYEIGGISYGQSSGNNEANERAYRTVGYIEIDASKQYKIYTDKLNNTYSPSPYYYFYYDSNKAYIARADSANITPPSNAKYIRFYEHIGEVLTQDRVNNAKCMMFESQSAPPFSSDMDYCEPILASAGDGDKIEILSVKSDGNLFVSDLKQGWIASGTGIYAPNSGNGNTSNDLFLKVTPNEKYYFNFELNTNKIFNVSIFKYDRNKKYLSSELMGIKSLKGSYTIPQNVEYVKFRFDRTNDGDECLISDFSNRLYFGKQNIDYIPPKYDRKQISTTLRGLPNGVKDVIEKHGNKYLHTARCCGKIIDNSFSPSKLVSEFCSDTITAFRVTLKDMPKITNLLSSMKVEDERVPNPTYEYISLKYTTGGIGVFDIGIANSKLSSLDNAGASAFLKANPIPIVGQLEVPIVTELPNLNLQTFLNKTTVLINSGSVQADIIFDVTESLGSSVEVMKDKLSSHDEVVSKFKNITFSIELPTDAQGSDGDIWIKYV